MNCRLCGSAAVLLGERADVAVFRCPRCAFVSGQARDEASAVRRYAGYHRKGPSPAAPEARYVEWLERLERLGGRGRLLEVGAGAGAFVRVAKDRGWEVDATEISESGLEHLRSTGARVFAGDLETAPYPESAFDAVVSLEVLEHLPAPLPHLRHVHRLLRPGGVLLLTTPNIGGLSWRMFGVRWRVVDPEHVSYFRPRVLALVLRDVGFGDVAVRSRSLDVSTWAGSWRGEAPRLDPHRSARLRDASEASATRRLAKAVANGLLGLTGWGDSLPAWARR